MASSAEKRSSASATPAAGESGPASSARSRGRPWEVSSANSNRPYLSNLQPMLLSGQGLSPQQVVAVARGREHVDLDPEAHRRMLASRAHVEAAGRSEQPVYGVSTGFGALAQTRIDVERRSDLQHALIRSHAAGAGPPVDAEVVRAMMLLRARTLAIGRSGARPVLAEALLALLN